MDRFVVGSGRCGSTLLSAMLAEDPALLSVSEFLVGLDRALRFDPATAAPERFTALLGRRQQESLNFTRRGIRMPEILYPYDDDGSRYELEDAIPWILQIALPSLTDDPDSLFVELIDMCRRLPAQPLPDQYRAVFHWLADRRGTSDWVERSGSSLEYMDELVDLFPNGRFLHLHRDGREAALSMREHAAFRYRVATLYEIPDQVDVRYSFMRTYDPMQGATEAIAKLDSSQYAEMAFEDLIGDPEGCLERIADFFELRGDRSRAHGCAARLVRGRPPTRFGGLEPEEQRALDEACRPGMQQIGRNVA